MRINKLNKLVNYIYTNLIRVVLFKGRSGCISVALATGSDDFRLNGDDCCDCGANGSKGAEPKLSTDREDDSVEIIGGMSMSSKQVPPPIPPGSGKSTSRRLCTSESKQTPFIGHGLEATTPTPTTDFTVHERSSCEAPGSGKIYEIHKQ